MLRPHPLTLRAMARHRSQIGSVLGGGAADLLEQDGDTDTAAARGVQAVFDRHVIVGDDGFHLDAGFFGGHLGGHLEVQDIAGVVLDDVQHAGTGVHELGGFVHLIGCRRREHLAGAGRVEHADADEAAVERLVSGAAARDETDLAGDG